MAWSCAMPFRGKPPGRSATPVMPIARVFDELRFGAARTLNLREGLPTVAQAEIRVESWLRLQQAEGGGEVLVITGRTRQPGRCGPSTRGGAAPVCSAEAVERGGRGA